MFKSEVYRAATTVVLFWWGVLTIYSIYEGGQSWSSAFHSWKYILFGVVFASAISVSVVALIIRNRFELADEAPDPVPRGFNMKTTMGPVPAWLGIPKLAGKDSIPALPKTIIFAILASEKKDARYRTLAEDLLRILTLHPDDPASPYETGHGGESLLNHTIRVTLKTLVEARDNEYTGLYSNAGRLIVGLRDTNYKFDKKDPLILLCALAHDIGKLDAYIRKGDKIVGMKRTHDTLSMLMLGRMPSLMALDYKDQRAMLGAVGYYHSPHTLPLDSAGRARDDRTIALLELLRRCDRDESADEDGFESPSDVAKIQIRTAKNKIISDDDIWDAFLSLVNEPGRVNGTSKAVTVGQKWESDVYFHEDRTHRELLRILGIPAPAKRGDGTNPITIRLMSMLLNKDILVNTFNGREYGPARSLFEVKFFDQAKGEEVGHWTACFIVRPDDQLTYLSQMKTHVALAVIQKPVMGEHAARNKKAAQTEAAQESSEDQSAIATEKDSPPAESPFPFAAPVREEKSVEGGAATSSPFPTALSPVQEEENKTIESTHSDDQSSADSSSEMPSASDLFSQDEAGDILDEMPSASDLIGDNEGAAVYTEPPVGVHEAQDEYPSIEGFEANKSADETRVVTQPAIQDETLNQAASNAAVTTTSVIAPASDEIDRSSETGSDAEDRMYAMCDTAQEEKDAQVARALLAEQLRKDLQKEREKKLPADQKAKLKKLDHMIDGNAVENFFVSSDEKSASIYICNLWRGRSADISAFKTGGSNPNNLYVMKTWLLKNAPQFKWDAMMKSGAISNNSDNGSIYLKFDLTIY